MEQAAGHFFSTDGLLVGTLVPFVFVLMIVVFIHELGHYLVGRWCGIGVKAFSIGFGPELLSYTDRRGTRWRLAAIPLGGYVKFVGDMNATSVQPDAEEVAALTDEERRHAFHVQPVWKRAATVFAGPLFNFLLAIAVFTVLFASYGRIVTDPVAGEVTPGSPAEIAGFMSGDRLLAMDGERIGNFTDIMRYVSPRAGEPIRFTVDRGGKEIELTVTPQTLETDDPLGNKVKRGIIGIRSAMTEENTRRIDMSVPEAFGTAVAETGYVIAGTGDFLGRLITGREDKCQLGGPVKIADMAGKAARKGFDWLVQLIALLSVGIGLLNLMPVPPLDGGHLMFYAYEAAFRRPVPEVAAEYVYRAGLLLVLGFMGFVFWNDLFGC